MDVKCRLFYSLSEAMQYLKTEHNRDMTKGCVLDVVFGGSGCHCVAVPAAVWRDVSYHLHHMNG